MCDAPEHNQARKKEYKFCRAGARFARLFSRLAVAFSLFLWAETRITNRKNIAVVVSWFRDDLTFLEHNIDCDVHDLYIYLKVTQRVLEPPWPNSIRRCSRVIKLRLSQSAERQALGKVHVAYLEHIARNYHYLHKVTIFVKPGVTDIDQWKSVHTGIAFMDVVAKSYELVGNGVDRVPIATRGKFRTGTTTFPSFDKTCELYLRIINEGDRSKLDYALLEQSFVGFRSSFAASRNRIRQRSLKTYVRLLDELQALSASNLHCYDRTAPKPSGCGNLIMERIWPAIMQCTSRYTPFHSIHQNSIWNPTLPKTCFDNPNDAPVYVLKLCRRDMVQMQTEWRSSMTMFKLYILAYFSIAVKLEPCAHILDESGSADFDFAPVLQDVFGIELVLHADVRNWKFAIDELNRQLPICVYYRACARAFFEIFGVPYNVQLVEPGAAMGKSRFESMLEKLLIPIRKALSIQAAIQL